MGAFPSSNRVSSHDRAILHLKHQRDQLKKYQKKIHTVLEAEHLAAKTLLRAGDKGRAMLALRRRQYQTSLLQQTDRQLETLEALTSSIEFALIEKDVLFGLQQGNQVLKEIHKEQKEISAMLAGVMTNDDEDE